MNHAVAHLRKIRRNLLASFFPLAIVGAACHPAAAQMFVRVPTEVHFFQQEGAAYLWLDFDNDGWTEPLCGGGWKGIYGSRLFHNNQNGTFTQVGESDFAGQGAHTSWNTVGDINDDGLLDVLTANGYSPTGFGVTEENPILFVNQGNGSFARISLDPSSVLGAVDLRSYTVAALDYNGDGLLDLVLGHYNTPSKSYLLRNAGGGLLAAVTNTAWTLHADAWEAIASVDYNGDGLPDLLGIGGTRPVPFRNTGAGNFVRDTSSLLSNFQVGQTSLSSAWGDFDNDGDLDVAITYVFSSAHDLQVFMNDGSGGFTTGFWSATDSQYAFCADYDNDSRLDLYVTGYRSRSRLYRNTGGGSFTEVMNEPIAQDVFSVWPIAAWGDYNNDGFLDVLVGATDSYNMLYRNSPNGNHWLKIKLTGQASNKAAIGAVVRATANIDGQAVQQMRVVQAQCLYTELMPHFGLGDATNVTTLRIEWPSGILQELHNVAADQILTVVESQGYTGAPPQFSAAVKTAGGVGLSFTEPAAGTRYLLEASTNLVTWTKLMARTSVGGSYQFTDLNGTNYTRRFYRLQVP